MSLMGKKLQVIDTCDVLFVDKTTGSTFMSGYTTKAGLEQQVEKLDVFAGIGGGKITSLRTKKTITLDVTMAEFNLDVLASQNGVALDKTSTSSYYINKPFSISSLSATVDDATRIIAVKDSVTGDFLKIVSGSPASMNEVQVTGNTITFYTGYTPTSCLVSYAAPAPVDKDNYTIVFYASSFPKNAEILMNTVAFDTDTQAIAADIYMHFYKGAIDPNFALSFEMGKNIETPMKVDILIPDKLPDGSVNANKEIGKFNVVER